MKTTITKLSIFSLLLLVLVSCKKDAEIPNGEFVNLKTNEATEITAVSAAISAKAEANCAERGVCWGKKPNPTIDDFHVANGSGKGEYACTLTDLEPNQKYYYRAYGFDGKRYAYAKDEKEFVTKDGVVKVTTDSVCEITTTSARVKCEVTHDGGAEVTERGVCWSKSANPTLDDAEHTASGNGTGSFEIGLTDLEVNTTYHVCAYATNALGIRYGNERTFTTKDGVAKVTTGDVTDITATSAKCSGEVTEDGGFAVTERGICWSTSPNPTLENAQHVAAGSGTGEFSATLTGLTEYTKYYVRAYATNSQDTSYGSNVSFTPGYLTFTANGVSFKMMLVEGGTFTMGATAEQGGDAESNEYPTHSVTLSSFYMGETEVTQALWQAVMGSNPSHFSGSNLPVECVGWNDCQEFITKLNQLCASQLNGRQFLLPTEAQWEYAARGGKNSQGYKYSGSNTLDNVAWYYDNSGSTTHAVATKQANELGLYDMSGNVYEWCSDWYGSYSSSAQTDPTGPASGPYRVYRGGSWFHPARYCRVSYRSNYYPGGAIGSFGLRLSLR